MLGCTTLAGDPCKFPFTYEGVRYEACTTDHSENGAPWCAVEVGIFLENIIVNIVFLSNWFSELFRDYRFFKTIKRNSFVLLKKYLSVIKFCIRLTG